MKKKKGLSRKKILIASLMAAVFLVTAVVSVVLVLAAANNRVATNIKINYLVDGVGVKISANYSMIKSDGEISQTTMVSDNGYDELVFDANNNEQFETLSPESNIVLSKDNGLDVVFEYKFTNIAETALKIDLQISEENAENNYNIYENYHVSRTQVSRTEFDRVCTDVMLKQPILNVDEELYIYVRVGVANINRHASYEKAYDWVLTQVADDEIQTVTLNNNAGKIEIDAVVNCAIPLIANLPDAPDGKGFEGYYSEQNGGGDKYVNQYGVGIKELPSSVTELYAYFDETSVIDFAGGVVYGISPTTNKNAIQNVIIPAETEEIADSAFKNNTTITSVTIADGTQTVAYAGSNLSVIGESAFEGCTNLNTFTFADRVNLKTIKASAFKNCSSLLELDIPRGIKSIGDYALYNCSKLTELIIPEGVTEIGEGALQNLSKLEYLVIPSTVTTLPGIGTELSPLIGCQQLKTLECHADILKHGDIYGAVPSEWLFQSGLDYLFGYYIDEIIEEEGQVYIVSADWQGTTPYISKVVVNGGTNLSECAFTNNGNITSVTLPNTLQSIGYGEFSVGIGAFYGTSISEIIIPSSVTSIGNSAFAYTDLTKITLSNSITTIIESSFRNCEKLTTITIPNSVTEIEGNVFSGCTSLTEVVIPNTVTSIGTGAFDSCPIEKLTAPAITDFKNIASAVKNTVTELVFNGGTRIGYWFGSCPALTSVIILNSVTEIAEDAFYNCANLTSVTIPNSVTKIEKAAFYNCSSLTNVYITDLAAWCKIYFNSTYSNPLCYGGNLYINNVLTTQIVIPDSVTEIGSTAFRGFTELTSVTIGNSVTTIGNNAFYGCTGLTTVIMGNSMTTIGMNAFYGCTGLTTVTMGNSVTTIGSNVFSGCTSLTEVVIPNTVTSIGTGAFDSCSKLADIYFKGSQTTWDEINNSTIPDECILHFVYDITTQEQMNDFVDNYDIDKSVIDTMAISGSVTTIPWRAFMDCSNLEKITIGSSVTNISGAIFTLCVSLQEINIDPNNTVYKTSERKDCIIEKATNKLVAGCDITIIPDYVTVIGSGAFYITDQSSIVIPDSVTIIEDCAFEYASCLQKITLSNSLISIGAVAFEETSISSLYIPGTLTSFGDSTFLNCRNLKEIIYGGTQEQWNAIENLSIAEIPRDCVIKFVTYVNSNDDFGNIDASAEIIVIKDGVTEIPANAFNGFSNLTSITIPNSVTTIGDSAFVGCTGLTSITIPDSVTIIGSWAFECCSGLTEIIIPDSVTTIGDSVFSSCESLTEIVIPSSITTINNGMFLACHGLTSITIPDSVTTIGSEAFSYCSRLTEITIPDSVTTIGGDAFYNCLSLTSVEIGNSVTTIGNYAFSDCINLSTVTFKNTTGWKIYQNSTSTTGYAITVTNATTNATNLKNKISSPSSPSTSATNWGRWYLKRDA